MSRFRFVCSELAVIPVTEKINNNFNLIKCLKIKLTDNLHPNFYRHLPGLTFALKKKN